MILEVGMAGGTVRRHGFTRRRVYGGRPRYTALYLAAEPNLYISAGTFGTKAEADAAWQEKVVELRRGIVDDPRKGRMTFASYAVVYQQMTAGHHKRHTRRSNRQTIARELVPFFGHLALEAVDYERITRWVADLRGRGYAAATIRTYKVMLSGMLSEAVRLRYIPGNPASQVRIPKEKPRRIKGATGEDVSSIMSKLPGAISTMMVHLAVQSGVRWGELTELRGRDVLENPDAPGCLYLEVQRAVADAGGEDEIFGASRFFVEDTTKGGRDRRIGLSRGLSAALRTYIAEHEVGSDDLLFCLSKLKQEWREANPEPELLPIEVPDDLGRTEPNANGATYKHGTLSAYTAGRCKCDWCRRAFAEYRAARRADGKRDRTKPVNPKTLHTVNDTDHISSDWFRRCIWLPTLEIASVSRHLTFADLRHTHATWLARSGTISVQELKERMGHASLDTTQRYIDDADIVGTEAADVIDDMLSGAKPAPRRRLRAV